jgi:hypothetical protein
MSCDASALSGDSIAADYEDDLGVAMVAKNGPVLTRRAKSFRFLKFLSLILLVGSTVVMATMTFVYSQDEEVDDFENQVS